MSEDKPKTFTELMPLYHEINGPTRGEVTFKKLADERDRYRSALEKIVSERGRVRRDMMYDPYGDEYEKIAKKALKENA